MYKMKYIIGKTIRYKGESHKIIGVRFTCGGTMYRLSGIREWIKEEDMYNGKYIARNKTKGRDIN